MDARSLRMKRHVAALGSSDKKVGQKSEECLIRYYGADAIPFLIPACDSPNSTSRYRAVWVLGHTKAQEVYETIRRLCDDPDEAVRYDALIALGIHADDRAIPYLIDLLPQQDHTRPVVSAIERLGEKALPALLTQTGHPSPDVRASILSLLEPWLETNPKAHQATQNALQDPDPDVREQAEQALSTLADKPNPPLV